MSTLGKFLFILSLMSAVMVKGQTGPGGVGATDASTSLILWLDADQITNVVDQNNITTWSDASGFGHDAGLCGLCDSNNKPNWIESSVNGFPTVSFGGAGELLSGEINLDAVSASVDNTDFMGLSAPITLIAVAFFDQANQSDVVGSIGNDNDYIFSMGDTNGEGEIFSIGRRFDDGASNENNYYSWDGNSPVISSSFKLSSATPYIFRHVQNQSAPFHEIFIDETSIALASNFVASVETSGIFELGDFSGTGPNSNVLQGDIAEVIMFDRILTAVEINILNSYLSAKYDISVGAADQYIGDDADPLGGGSDGEFDFNVAGVGVESGTNLSGYSKGLSVTQSTNFDDGDYLLFGHKTKVNSLNNTDINDTDVTDDLAERWSRVWFLDVTDAGGVMTIDAEIDFKDSDLGNSPAGPASNYKLLFRNNNTDGTSWDFVGTASSVVGKRVTFSDVTTSGDGYYTIGTIDNSASPLGISGADLSANGPGGIGNTDGTTTLRLWLSANDIGGEDDDPIVRWNDLSGYGSDADADNLRIPKYRTSIATLNNQNVVRFDENGNDDTDFSNPQGMSGTLDGALVAPVTVVAVALFNETQGNEDNDYVFGLGTSGTANQYLSISRRKNNDSPITHTNEYYSWYGDETPRYGPVINDDTWNIFVQHHDAGSGTRHSLYIDGTAQAGVIDYTSELSVSSSYAVGRFGASTTNNLDGDIAEIIVFSESLNIAKRNILQSYLSGKYNISIDASVDKYNGDLSVNGDNDLNIAGVGSDADGNHDTASSAGLQITTSGGFASGDYVMFGHNVSDNSVNSSDVNGTLDERWDRAWWFTITDVVPTVSVDVVCDISEGGTQVFPSGTSSNYKLIYSATGTAPWTEVASASSTANDQIFFTNVSLTSDGYYTLATENANDSPLPVELVMFDARDGADHIKLEWETLTESNNDRFEIQRSYGDEFSKIGEVKGNGTKKTSSLYAFEDYSFDDRSLIYYRLKQVDFDGQFSISHAIGVHRQLFSGASIYPNPAFQMATVSFGEVIEHGNLEVWDISGMMVHSIKIDGRSEIHMNVKGLKSGIYLLQVSSHRITFSSRLIVR